MLAIGQRAADFRDLQGVDGNQYSLATFAHHPFLVVAFVCTGCPTVKANEERLVALQERYNKAGVQLVAIRATCENGGRHGLCGSRVCVLFDRLKERLVRAVAAVSHARSRAPFDGGVTTVKRAVVRQRETGSLERRPSGLPARDRGGAGGGARARLVASPDATVLEHWPGGRAPRPAPE